MNYSKIISFIIQLLIVAILLVSCGLYKKTDKNVPIQGEERARKNLEEGRGISLKNLTGGSSMNYEFSSANPMWRASLEILDFIPLTTVDYSGGIIITDWYSQSNSLNESIKITIRFLSNEIAATNLKIKVHKKLCRSISECEISELNSKIKVELLQSILKKAAEIETKSKTK